MKFLIIASIAILGCVASPPGPKVKGPKMTDEERLKEKMKKMEKDDWSKPKFMFKKYFGKTLGTERHSLSNSQMDKLLKEVQNKTEWQAASMTTYWDCSSQYCLSFKPGRENLRKNSCPNVNNENWHKGPRSTDHANEKLGLFEGKDGHLYGTVAASASLGVDDKDAPGCGKCYTFRRGDLASFGGFFGSAKLTVMVSNYCPAARDAPCPLPGKVGEFGTKFHFDLAVPGGGMGTMPTCVHTYANETGRSHKDLKEAFNNTLDSCEKLPSKLRNSCKLYKQKIAKYPLNIGLAFTEVECPTELTSRFECNTRCPNCEEPLSWRQLDKIVKKGEGLSKTEAAAYDAKLGMKEYQAKQHQSFKQKLAQNTEYWPGTM